MVAKSDTPKPSPTSESPKGGEPQKPKAEMSPAADQLGAMMNTVVAVQWESPSSGGPIRGALTVAAALNAPYSTFVVDGAMFQIAGSAPGVTSFGFTYSGPMSFATIADFVRRGAQIFLSH